MFRVTSTLLSIALTSLAACGSKTSTVVEECGDGMGRADDGICYPLAGYDDAGTTNATEDSGGSGNNGSGGGSDNGSGSGSGSGSGDGSGSGSDGSSGSGSGDSGTAVEAVITISGEVTFPESTSSGANCNISSWMNEAIDTSTGDPDRTNYSENDLQFFSCSNHTGGPLAYEVDITVDTAAEVAFFAFVDPDGDASTPDYSVASDANPVSVEAGGVYTGIDFVITSD